MEKVIAIDFDGCLCENAWPEIGAPHWAVIHKALEERRNGAKLILWTCREGAVLEAAVAACKGWGLEFDAVNDSLESWKVRFGNDTRKIGATEYWDDKAVKMDGSYSDCSGGAAEDGAWLDEGGCVHHGGSHEEAHGRCLGHGRGKGLARQRMTGLRESRAVAADVFYTTGTGRTAETACR